jgi:hypothetical protein
MPQIPQPPDPRQQYESLLNDVLDEAHKLLLEATETDPALTGTIDDSRLHRLIRNLRDNFGPEVPR